MKWLIIKIMTWWNYRLWLRVVKLVDGVGVGHLSTAALIEIWDNTPNLQLMRITPRKYYLETDICTVTTNITDLRKWLTSYLLTIKRFNTLTDSEMEQRPENTYLDIKEVVLSDRMVQDLDSYMRNSNNAQLTYKYYFDIMTLVRAIDIEMNLIDDPIEYTYFLRRAHEIMQDVWQINKTLVEAGRFYEPSE